MKFNINNKVLTGLIGLCLYVTLTSSLCSYNDQGYCTNDPTYAVSAYTCGGVTQVDNSYFGFTANKYCQPITSLPPSDSPCAGKYSSGGGVCWPYAPSTGSGIPLAQYTSAAWANQLKQTTLIYNSCKNGSYNPYESSVKGTDMQKTSQGGYACCDTWAANKNIALAFCNDSSCYCPPACSNPALNVKLPATTSNGLTVIANDNYCYSDCTDCMNLYYGARSNSICTNVGYSESSGAYFTFASESSCSCCRLYNGSNPSTTPSNPSSSPTPTSKASQSRSPGSSSSNSASHYVAPSTIPGVSFSSTPSRSNLPSPSPTASSSTINGTEDSSLSTFIANDSKNLSNGAIAGIVIGSIAGFFLLLLIVAIIVGVVVFLVVRARRSSSIQGIASPSGTMYNAGV